MQADDAPSPPAPSSPPAQRHEARKGKKRVIYLSPPQPHARRRRAAPQPQSLPPQLPPAQLPVPLRDARDTESVCQAKTSRTSIAARPPLPTEAAEQAAKRCVNGERQHLREWGYHELAVDFAVQRDPGQSVAAGPMLGVPDDAEDAEVAAGGARGSVAGKRSRSRKLLKNHLVTVRAKSIASQPRHASWLVPKRCPLVGRHLLETALRSNSVNNVMFGKKETESSSLQISRYNFLPLADAQAAQQVSCLFTLAAAETSSGLRPSDVVQVGARNAVDMALLVKLRQERPQLEDDARFPVAASSQLAVNALPFKLTNVSLGTVGRDLARAELSPARTITETAGTLYATLLRRLCQQCTGRSASAADPLWSSVGLITYCAMTAAGRSLLGSTNLTDFDVVLAGLLESYGRAEIRRRESHDGTATGNGADAGSEPALAPPSPPADEMERRLEELSRQESEETQARLSSKKRRDASFVDPLLGVHWWVCASETKHVAVLKTLLCNQLSDAEVAALDNLKSQSREYPSLMKNTTLRNVSIQNAKDCVRAVGTQLACRVENDVPAFKRLKPPPAPSAFDFPDPCHGPRLLLRTQDELRKTVVFASGLAPTEFQPAGEAAIAWTFASIEPRTHKFFDLLGEAETLRASDSPGKMTLRRAERIEQEALRLARPKTPEGAALARSFFTHMLFYELSDSQKRAAMRFAGNYRLAASGLGLLPPFEPFATNAPGLATGLLVVDLLTRWRAGKPRKTDFCELQLGYATNGEQPVAIPDVNSSSPLPLAVITDVRARLDPDSTSLSSPSPRFSVGLSLALDGAIRLPEALRQLQGNHYDAQIVQQCRALLWAGMSQASLIGNLGSVLTCGAINSSIACSRRLTIADNTRWLGLSVFDCFTGGLVNVEPSFVKSAYAGVYGPVFDSGISPPGKEGCNLNHDRRQHGSFLLSQELSDELAAFFATKHFAVCEEDKTYVPTPVATRGIPHMLVPGVYTALDDYVDSLERLREKSGRTDAKTVEGVFVLPYANVTQALAPVAEEFADSAQTSGIRSDHVKRGYAYQPTATAEEDALLREPLFRRPSVASIYDNPFANAYDYAETFYNLANGLVLLARLDCPDTPPAQRVESLFRNMCEWVEDGERLMRCPATAYYADALLMIACMFPATHQINKPMIPEFLAVGIPALQRALRSSADDGDAEGPSLNLRALVDDDLCAAGRAFVAKLRRAWEDIAPLLELLDELDGRHDLARPTRVHLRTCFERAVRAAYYFQLDESGEVPYGNPAYGATQPDHIGRVAIDPILVGVEEEREEARGGIIGMKPHAFRQVAALAMGAHIDGAQVQVVRNEGGLALRVSSAPDVLDAKGKRRTRKAMSPIQMESDSKLFGTLSEKLVTCKLQRAAWDANIRLLAPVFGAVSLPRPAAYRHRCKHGAHLAATAASNQAHSEYTLTEDDAKAKRDIQKAATFQWDAGGGVGGAASGAGGGAR